jgi:hypothetical protein
LYVEDNAALNGAAPYANVNAGVLGRMAQRGQFCSTAGGKTNIVAFTRGEGFGGENYNDTTAFEVVSF